jgi:hypothetical protein
MSTANALRVQASTCQPDDMDLVDLRMWAGTACGLLEIGATEIERLLARDHANVETIKVLAQTLTRRDQ